MKYLLIIHLVVLVAAIYGCRDSSSPVSGESIPGTYIRFSKHEFGQEYDTIILERTSSDESHFLVTRRWRYERVNEMPTYTKTTTVALFNTVNRTLEDGETGDVLIFDIKQGLLYIGATKYQKL